MTTSVTRCRGCGFGTRRDPDCCGEANDRSFYVASSSDPSNTATVQIQPGHYWSLSRARSITPDAADQQVGLILSIDGLAVEAYGNAANGSTPAATFDQLTTLVGSLEGIAPPPAG